MIISTLQNWLKGRTVVVTGHTGFKGSWLCAWLNRLGAHVVGISLPPEGGRDSLFESANIASLCTSYMQDIRDADAIETILRATQPVIVFHLAAQALVRPAYANPLSTFSTNIMGTAHILEAARLTSSVKALVCVTTDKVYENPERNIPFTELDPLGGIDPYSASKAACELVARSYMRALIPIDGHLQIATARGGNVVGGGDWSLDRIVPDIIRAWQAGNPITLRNPQATRPWQHVLELCFGYIVLAYRLENGRASQERGHFRGEWNFGPEPENEMTVDCLVRKIVENLGVANYPIVQQPSALHESTYLRLNSDKAKAQLGWKPLLSFDDTVQWTCDWYRQYQQMPGEAEVLMQRQIPHYETLINRYVSEL